MVILGTLIHVYITGNLSARPTIANMYKALITVSGTVLCVCYVSTNLILIITLRGSFYYYSHFIGKEMEAERI